MMRLLTITFLICLWSAVFAEDAVRQNTVWKTPISTNKQRAIVYHKTGNIRTSGTVNIFGRPVDSTSATLADLGASLRVYPPTIIDDDGTPLLAKFGSGTYGHSVSIDPYGTLDFSGATSPIIKFDSTNSNIQGQANQVIATATTITVQGTVPAGGTLSIAGPDASIQFFAGNIARSTGPGKGLFYLKGTKFVLSYNDGGTTRYTSIDMSATGNYWTSTTLTAP